MRFFHIFPRGFVFSQQTLIEGPPGPQILAHQFFHHLSMRLPNFGLYPSLNLDLINNKLG